MKAKMKPMRALVMRQSIRKALLLVALLLWPVTLYYFSPALIFEGTSERLINGSFIVFSALLFLSLIFGRVWCGWLCPGAALQEMLFAVNDKRLEKPRDWIRWAIWIPWITSLALVAFFAGGYERVDFFYRTHSGVSVGDTSGYIVYYTVLVVFFSTALIAGRRAACHRICWMSPFMVIGRKVSNTLHLPALRLAVTPDKCVKCEVCTRNCPMSLNVAQMVQSGRLEHPECVLCGTCVDSCKQKAIDYAFTTPQKH
ncbi:MAG: 4Fe-4S ferredoxin [[Chlorobium] sp. 445]|nr:MAG: 4Fe-4S ferredoxin [[Chlorobium] sp. 445]